MDTIGLEHVQQSQKYIGAISKLIDFMSHDVHVWDQGEGYQRCGRLTYFNLLPSFISSAKFHEGAGHMTARQLKEWRLLQRQLPDALGMLKILNDRNRILDELEAK